MKEREEKEKMRQRRENGERRYIKGEKYTFGYEGSQAPPARPSAKCRLNRG
jgi:hypothetical protein